MKKYIQLGKINRNFGTICVAALVVFIGCGKKDDGGGAATPSPVAPPVVVANGQLCGVGQGLTLGNILNNVQFQTPHMQGTLNMIGVGNANWADPAVYASYAGPVTFSGCLTVLDNSYCGAPVNVPYLVTGTANYMIGVLSSVVLLAGPIQLRSDFANSRVYNPGSLQRDAPGNRVELDVQMTVNSLPCGPIITY